MAWGYPDQPPLAPALARLVGSVAPDSLVALRLPSALMAAGVVLLNGMIARELGGRRAEQLLAAACMAVAGVLLGVAHLLSTTTIDLLAWVAVCWVGARILRGGDPRWWLAAGAILGVALLNKSLIAVLPVALLISGPRRVLTTRWFPLGVALAVVIVAPTCGGRRRTDGRRWRCPAPSRPADPGRRRRGGCSSRTSWCWFLRCSCRCRRIRGDQWKAVLPGRAVPVVAVLRAPRVIGSRFRRPPRRHDHQAWPFRVDQHHQEARNLDHPQGTRACHSVRPLEQGRSVMLDPR